LKGGFGLPRSWITLSDSRRASPFAGQVFNEGWIVAKACYYSFLRESGPEDARIREYKLLEDETYLSLNHLARLERPLTMKKDQSSKTGQKPWLLTAKESARIEMFL